MADNVTFTVDASSLLSALRDFPDVLQPRLKATAKVTAEAVRSQARSRIRRATGRTAERMRVDETYKGDGYVVVMGDAVEPEVTKRREQLGMRRTAKSGSYKEAHVGVYLEFGTRFQSARPFLFVSADVERGAHDRRVRQTIVDTLQEKGLG